MTDPYKILGVSPSDSDEDIKKAYRKLAVKYHPDNNIDNPLADLAEEKMKEINKAYDQIQQERSGKGRHTSYDYGSSDGYRTSSTSTAFAEVRTCINNSDISRAWELLNNTPAGERNAEWNFLMGCVCLRRQNFFDAQKYINNACYMDPSNAEYRNMKNNLDRSGAYGRNPYNTTNTGDCDMCDVCNTLICLNCLCGGCR